jgi:hypothetical protein
MKSVKIKKDICKFEACEQLTLLHKTSYQNTTNEKGFLEIRFDILTNVSHVVLLQWNDKHYLSSSTPPSVRGLCVSLRLDLKAEKTGPYKKHNNVTYFVLNTSFGYVNTSSF